MTTNQAESQEELEDTAEEEYLADNEDVVLVIGDVGVEGFQRGTLFWVGVGGTALNLADMLCEYHGIQTWLMTRADPLHGWMAIAGIQRFHDIHGGLASTRIYQMASSKNLQDLNRNFGDVDVSNYLAIATGPDIRFETQTGRDIDLMEQLGSIREAIERSLVAVVDTHLTAETLSSITKLCQDHATPLIVMSNARKASRDKFIAIGNAGGCDMLVMNPQDKLLFSREVIRDNKNCRTRQ